MYIVISICHLSGGSNCCHWIAEFSVRQHDMI